MAKRPQEQQIDKFREAARELGTDDSEENFDRMVKKIAKTKPGDKDRRKQSDS